MKIVKKVIGVIGCAVGGLSILLGLILLADKSLLGFTIFFLVLGAILIVGGRRLIKGQAAGGEAGEPAPPAADTPSSESAPPAAVDPDPAVHPGPVEHSGAADPQPAPKAEYERFRFNVAGVSFRNKEILSIAEENSDYEFTKREIIEYGMVGERIYRNYTLLPAIDLVPEPDNPHDPNAIKVVCQGVHIGYVPREFVDKVRDIYQTHNDAAAGGTISGGDYKVLYEDYDPEKDKDVYTMKRGTDILYVEVVVFWQV